MHSVRAPNVLKLLYNYVRNALPMYSVRALTVISERAPNSFGARCECQHEYYIHPVWNSE